MNKDNKNNYVEKCSYEELRNYDITLPPDVQEQIEAQIEKEEED